MSIGVGVEVAEGGDDQRLAVAADVAADHHRRVRGPVLEQDLLGLLDLVSSGCARPGCRSPAPGRPRPTARSRSSITAQGLSRSDSDSTA